MNIDHLYNDSFETTKNISENSKVEEQKYVGHNQKASDEYISDQDKEKYDAINSALNTEEVVDQLNKLEGAPFIPSEMLNYTIPWRTESEYPEPLLENFVPKTSTEYYRFDEQVPGNP